AGWNQTARAQPAIALHRRASEQAARTPDAIAVRHGAATLTYRELDRRSNQVAHHLVRLGAARRPVALAFHPSLEMTIAVLGVLKAGGACVPLDPDDPAERRSRMLAETGAPLTLSRDTDWGAIAREPDGDPGVAPD